MLAGEEKFGIIKVMMNIASLVARLTYLWLIFETALLRPAAAVPTDPRIFQTLPAVLTDVDNLPKTEGDGGMGANLSADDTFLWAKTADMVVGAAGHFVAKARQEFPVVRAYLFGDWARGLRRPRSPVSVAIFLKSFGGRTEREMQKEFFRLKAPYHWVGLELHLLEAEQLASDSVFIVDMLETGLAL
jgi:hypothetical protein